MSTKRRLNSKGIFKFVVFTVFFSFCVVGQLSNKGFEIMAESDSVDPSERYEFDAPSQVVDLKELENTESDDRWFGKSPSTV